MRQASSLHLQIGNLITNPHFPQRKSPRLQRYDYSQSGAYFVTICTHERYHLFGDIRDGTMLMNDAGKSQLNAGMLYRSIIPI
jgi:hypothetical protein